MAVMVVSENWIPYASTYEKMLVDALATLWRRSVKGLRYGLPANKPIAAALLLDGPNPVALYIVPPDADAAYEDSLRELLGSRSEMRNWVWRPAEEELPPLATLIQKIRAHVKVAITRLELDLSQTPA